MHARLRDLARRQGGVVAGWQLLGLGWNRAMIDHAVGRNSWQVVHRGVYAVSPARLSRWQRWRAATLTTPCTYLAGASAAACFGFRPVVGRTLTVVRPGGGGPRRTGDLLVAHSGTLRGATTQHVGLPIVTAPRALIDLAPKLGSVQLGKAFRESIRLKATTADNISRALHGQRGTSSLAALCDRYATIPYHRCRSDAEARALEVLHDARVSPPEVNVQVAGREADLVWRPSKLLIEIDSREFHQFTDQDLIKEARWRSAGFTVHRIWANDVFHRSHRLLAKTNVHLTHA